MKYGFLRALLWVLSYLVLALTPMGVAYLGPAPARTFWIELSVGLGFAGLAIMLLQFLLSGRYQNVATAFGLDSMLQFHRQAGFVAVGFILAHPAILFVADSEYFSYLDPRVDWIRALALAAVTAALLLLVASSLWRLTFRLSYEWWRALHGALALFVVFIGLVHILQVGYYVSEPWKQGFLVLATGGGVGLLVNTRIVRPWRMRRLPYRVREVREEQGESWSLAVAPEGHAGMRFRPGQFAWITLRESPFSLQQNPYSFSSSSEDAPGRIEFTIKVEGDFSASVRETKPGMSAFLEGPYGYFVPERDPGMGCVMIVGGVGVTPCMSMLRTFANRGDPRDLHLIYANVSLDEVIFYHEIDRLEKKLNLTVTHVLEEAPEGWEGEIGLIDRGLIERHLPANPNEYEYFLCGPAPMMNIAESALRELGVQQRLILSERFNMV